MIPRPSRRAALGLTIAAPLLTGCSTRGVSLDDLRPPTPATPSPPPNPDAALLRDLVGRIEGLARTTPDPWRTLHLTQLRALGHTEPVPPEPTARTPTGAETQLHDALLDGCVAAHSPDLARLLASMAAGVAEALRGAGS